MQTPEHNRDREEQTVDAPPALVSALKRSAQAPIFIPPMVDEAILRAAHRQLARQKSSRFKWSLLVRWAFAAAALALLLAILPQAFRKSGSAPGTRFANRDLNHDGQLDILDAFALARELKSGAHPSPQLDINGDGVVDERDVAALAARAVTLGKGGRS